MKINYLDHVNIRTVNVAGLVEFYGAILKFEPGPRPDFPFDGAWLYCGDRPVIHLVATADPTGAPWNLRLEHFAFAAEGLSDFLAHLRQHGVAYRVGVAPGFGIQQVNFHDPDGNHLHVDFAPEEAADCSPFTT